MVSVNGDSLRVIHEPVKQGDGMFCIAVLEKLEAVAARIVTLAGDALVMLDGRNLVTL